MKTEAAYKFYFEYLATHGMSDYQAQIALELDQVCRVDSARRAYNDIKPESEKDRKGQEEMKEKYSPVVKKITTSIYEHARKIRESKESNLTMDI